jgi:hypothetical protein
VGFIESRIYLPHLASMDSFSFYHYASTLSIHTLLLIFIILFLPRTSLLYYESPSLFPFTQRSSSLDRPQPPFLEPLTASPVLTLGWICLGIAVLILWWSRWVRRWAYDERHKGSEQSDFEARTEWTVWQNRGLSVSCPSHFLIIYIFLVVTDGIKNRAGT